MKRDQFDPMASDGDNADGLEPMPQFEVSFTVFGDPVAKGRPRFTVNASTAGVQPRGRAYTPQRTRTYEATVAKAARAAMGVLAPTTQPVQMTLVVFVPIPASWSKRKRAQALAGLVLPTGKPDLDNYEKAVTDALNEICYRDDSQICDVTKSKRYGETPRVVVRLFALDGFRANTFYVPKQTGKKTGAKNA
jgi:Holliday junction resolvase RusA-like endonuclease